MDPTVTMWSDSVEAHGVECGGEAECYESGADDLAMLIGLSRSLADEMCDPVTTTLQTR